MADPRPSIDYVLEKSLYEFVASKNSWAASYIKGYLPDLSAAIQNDLEAVGYVISVPQAHPKPPLPPKPPIKKGSRKSVRR